LPGQLVLIDPAPPFLLRSRPLLPVALCVLAAALSACADDRGDPAGAPFPDASSGEPSSPDAGAPAPRVTSTLALLPDTQYYSSNFPEIFVAQTSWIATHAAARSIPYVLHLGDLVDNNSPLQWQRAADALKILDGIVPYALVGGNHDYGPGGTATTRDTLLNVYVPYQRTAALPSFGGAYEPGKLDNTYHFVSLGGRDYIVLALEWGPRDAVIAWANQVMLDHPHHYGILITHAYLYSDNRRYDFAADPSMPWNPHQYNTAGGVNDGEELWQKLVRRHAFAFVFNGHVLNDGNGYLASVTDKGNICHQMLSNYQIRRLGGEGYMRLLEFLDDARTVRVSTYSPLLDWILDEPDQNFTVTIDLPPGPKP
jgi:3',5'-cyclic AMP phosphodiesterase CpdA